MVHELAGKPAPESILINVSRLITYYYSNKPDPDDPSQRIAFGTSGHRGSSFRNSFNENHILAICQAICEYRSGEKIDGPLFLGMDTHALSEPALVSSLEVFAANNLSLLIQQGLRYTPTPAISHAILTYNRGRKEGFADGVVITPSHNPPEDGGFKYNPPNGGPAGSDTTKWIQDRANEILRNGLREIKRIPFERAIKAGTTHMHDYIDPYVKDLMNIVNMQSIAAAGMKIGVDPLGGSSIDYWDPISDLYDIPLSVVNRKIDPTFSFMSVDKDGKIRMDCSSPYAMAGLIRLKDQFDLAFGNDTDTDRHGIVTRSGGLMNPNHYLAVAIWYLYQNRNDWRPEVGVGKTIVSSSMIDRVSAHLNRRLVEVPVGFKSFVDGLIDGSLGFGGEESAGASFLRKDGTVWTTDKDGIIMDLLAAEILACTKKDPAEIYSELTERFGNPVYKRMDEPASPAQKAVLLKLSPEMVPGNELAGDPIIERLTKAPGNNAAIGGLKVVTKHAWFAARPSGTEDIYKIYLESFKGEEHLRRLQEEATALIKKVFKNAGV